MRILSMNRKCCARYDGFPMLFWIKAIEFLLNPIMLIFQKMLETGYVPDMRKISQILPLYKNKGVATNHENYRGSNILCTISKIFEQIIYNYIHSILLRTDALSALQFGFRKNGSTTQNLVATCDYLSSVLDEGNCADIIFFDLSKSFDRVPHDILLAKLVKLNIDL